jgi:hypothetical protein
LLKSVILEGIDKNEWIEALKRDQLFGLFKSIVSHPTDLISRHAGEILSAEGFQSEAVRWFDLGIEVGERGGDTMKKIAAFTRRLKNGEGPDLTAPVGSVNNPSYEYR